MHTEIIFGSFYGRGWRDRRVGRASMPCAHRPGSNERASCTSRTVDMFTRIILFDACTATARSSRASAGSPVDSTPPLCLCRRALLNIIRLDSSDPCAMRDQRRLRTAGNSSSEVCNSVGGKWIPVRFETSFCSYVEPSVNHEGGFFRSVKLVGFRRHGPIRQLDKTPRAEAKMEK